MSMTQKQFASLGGKARAAKLNKRERTEIAHNAGIASGLARKATCKQDQGQVTPNGENKDK